MPPKLQIDINTAMRLYSSGESCKDIAAKMNCSLTKVNKTLREIPGFALRNPSSCYRRYAINDLAFETLDEEACYWLGFIAADGCINRANEFIMDLHAKDQEHLAKFAKFLGSEHPIKKYKSKPDMTCFRFKNKPIIDRLQKLGILKQKTFRLVYPKTIPPDMARHFWRGYFDGDGCICLTEKTKAVTLLGTREMLLSITKAAGISVKPKPHKSVYSMYCNLANATRLLYYLYDDNTISLDRKQILYEKWIRLSSPTIQSVLKQKQP